MPSRGFVIFGVSCGERKLYALVFDDFYFGGHPVENLKFGNAFSTFSRIDGNFNRYALGHLGEIPRGVAGRYQRELRGCTGGYGKDLASENFLWERINVEFDVLTQMYSIHFCFFQINDDPAFRTTIYGINGLPGLCDVTRQQPAFGNNAVAGCVQFGIVELCLNQSCLGVGALDGCACTVYLCFGNLQLGVCGGDLCLGCFAGFFDVVVLFL